MYQTSENVEIWKKVIRDDKETNYSISNLSRVRDDETGIILEYDKDYYIIFSSNYELYEVNKIFDKLLDIYRQEVVAKAIYDVCITLTYDF